MTNLPTDLNPKRERNDGVLTKEQQTATRREYIEKNRERIRQYNKDYYKTYRRHDRRRPSIVSQHIIWQQIEKDALKGLQIPPSCHHVEEIEEILVRLRRKMMNP